MESNNKNLKPINRAAIYLSPTVCENDMLALQITACRDFIKQNGWVSSDLFVERKGNAIRLLALARAWSGEFDYLVSYVEFALDFPATNDKLKGVIACIDAKSFAQSGISQLTLEEKCT